MSYTSKSEYKKLEASLASGFISRGSGVAYMGPYVQLSNGKTYAGIHPEQNLGEIFIPRPPSSKLSTKKQCRIYGALKEDTKNYLEGVQTITPTKNIPTEKDYERGFYNRYFVKRKNSSTDYKEVDQKIYTQIIQGSGATDHYLHEASYIKWAIIGNVFKINSKILKLKKQYYPHIDILFPLINEFHRPDLVIQEDLTTEGNELYYIDGTEYIGLYHIHPKMGPMEGDKHIEDGHKRLYYVDKLPNMGDTSYEDFLKSQIDPPEEEITKSIKSPILPESSNTSTGGGGY